MNDSILSNKPQGSIAAANPRARVTSSMSHRKAQTGFGTGLGLCRVGGVQYLYSSRFFSFRSMEYGSVLVLVTLRHASPASGAWSTGQYLYSSRFFSFRSIEYGSAMTVLALGTMAGSPAAVSKYITICMKPSSSFRLVCLPIILTGQ